METPGTGFTETVARYCAGATDDFICKIFNVAVDPKLAPHRLLIEKLIADRTVDGNAAERAILAFTSEFGYDREKLIAAYSDVTSKMISSALSMLTVAYIPLFIFMLIVLAVIAVAGYGKFALIMLIIFTLVYILFLIIAYYCAQWYAQSMLNELLAMIERLKAETGTILTKVSDAVVVGANAYLNAEPATPKVASPPTDGANAPLVVDDKPATTTRTGKARPQKAKMGDVELRVVAEHERSDCVSTETDSIDSLSHSNC